jgi:YggT family protein
MNPLSGVLSLVALIGVAFEICLIGRSIFSWIEPYPKNAVHRFFIQVTEPVVRPVRQVIRPVAGLDLSVLIVFVVVGIVIRVLTNLGAAVPFPIF